MNRKRFVKDFNMAFPKDEDKIPVWSWIGKSGRFIIRIGNRDAEFDGQTGECLDSTQKNRS